jgi:hypothetical protein
MIRPLAALVICSMLAGCETTVHVRLSTGDDEIMAHQCDMAVLEMSGFYAELTRGELVLKKCIDLPRGLGQPTSLAKLEGVLASRIFFDEVPEDDGWSIWVEGFSTADCSKSGAPLLCGTKSEVSIPPDGDEITVDVACSATIPWTAEGLESCRFK